jgi:hypothetical protein
MCVTTHNNKKVVAVIDGGGEGKVLPINYYQTEDGTTNDERRSIWKNIIYHSSSLLVGVTIVGTNISIHPHIHPYSLRV